MTETSSLNKQVEQVERCAAPTLTEQSCCSPSAGHLPCSAASAVETTRLQQTYNNAGICTEPHKTDLAETIFFSTFVSFYTSLPQSLYESVRSLNIYIMTQTIRICNDPTFETEQVLTCLMPAEKPL